MKMTAVVNYDVNEVFKIFARNAKRDFKDFDEKNPVGCKVIKNITTGGNEPLKCTVEITDYIKNKKYQITTSNNFTTCISTYTFEEKSNGTTLLTLDEFQKADRFFQMTTLYLQRFLARHNFKIAFKNIIDSLNSELRIYHENIDRSKPKSV